MTIYYTSPNGSDSNSGLSAAPFRTIQRGVISLTAGDTLRIATGVYHEVVYVHQSGTAEQPITIEAAFGANPVLDGAAGVGDINSGLPVGNHARVNPVTGAAFVWGGLLNVTGSHIKISGLEVTRSMGRGIRVYNPPGATITNVLVEHCNIHHSRAENLLFFGSGAVRPISDIVVKYSELSHSGNFYQGRRSSSVANWPGCLSIVGVDGGLVKYCTVHENWGEPILVDGSRGQSRGVTIEDNILYDNYSNLYVHATTEAVVQRNYIYRSVTDVSSDNPYGPTMSIVVQAAEPVFGKIPTDNVKVLNNIIVGTGFGIAVRGFGGADIAEVSNVLIAHNTIAGCSEFGVHATASNQRNIEFVNNIVSCENGKHVNGQQVDEWTYSNNMWATPPSALNSPSDVLGSPLFVNAIARPRAGEGEALDYRITPHSPAVGAGADAGVTDDYFHNQRDASPDIGAHETNKVPVEPEPPVTKLCITIHVCEGECEHGENTACIPVSSLLDLV